MSYEDTESGIKKSQTESNKIMDKGEKSSKKIENQSQELYDDAIDYTLKVSQKNKPFTANALVAAQIDADMRKILKATDKSYNDFIKAIEVYLSEGYDINLTKADLQVLAKKSSLINEQLVNNTAILKSDIQVLLYANIGKGVPKKELSTALASLYPAYVRNSYTIVNTGLARTFVDTNVTKFREIGFDWYIWAGPDDSLTREIPCKHWVRKKFKSSDLNTIAGTRQRLWNCRHNIIPVSDDMAKNYSLGNLSYAKK